MIENMLEERAWAERNGLDALAWNPDAVAPPVGDVYEREAGAGARLKAWGWACIALAMVALAVAVRL